MATSTRLLQVTSDNPLIGYEPAEEWNNVSKTSNAFLVGDMGAPMSSFLTTTENGTMTYIFNGSYIETRVSFMDMDPQPIVACAVDGDEAVIFVPEMSQNNWRICSSGNLSAGEHILTIYVQAQPNTFFFDYFLYAPSSEDQFNNAFSLINAIDPSVTYSDFISEDDTDTTRFVTTEGGFINVSFTGKQLTWFGAYSGFLPSTPSSAEYSIDMGTFQQFPLLTLDKPTDTAATFLDQVLFQTEVLPQGPHEVAVRYLGNETQAALSLSFLIIQNSTNNGSFQIQHGQSSTPNSTQTLPASTPSNLASPTSIITSSALSSVVMSFSPTDTKSVSTVSTSSSSSTSSSVSMGSHTIVPASSAVVKTHVHRLIELLVPSLLGAGILICATVIAAIYLRRKRTRHVLEVKNNGSQELPAGGRELPAILDGSVKSSFEAPRFGFLTRQRTMRTMRTGTSDSLFNYNQAFRCPSAHSAISEQSQDSSQDGSTEALIPIPAAAAQVQAQVQSLFTENFGEEYENRLVSTSPTNISQIVQIHNVDYHLVNLPVSPTWRSRPLPSPPVQLGALKDQAPPFLSQVS